MKNTVKRTALLGLFSAVAIVFAYIEVLLPPLLTAIPGIKLGLPNVVIVFMLYRRGAGEAIAVSLVRILAVSMLFGNFASFAYSIAGGALSLLAMIVLKKMNFLSHVGVSVAGGVLHNVGQILMAMLLLGTAELGYYLVVLAVTGTVAGVLIGICGGIAISRVPDKYL